MDNDTALRKGRRLAEEAYEAVDEVTGGPDVNSILDDLSRVIEDITDLLPGVAAS